MKSVISIAALVLLGACAKKDGSGALHAGDMLVRVQLDPDPPVAGDNVLWIELMDAQGKGIDGAQIGFIYDMAAMGAMPEMKGGGDVKAKGGGRYGITYPLSMLGDWTLTLGIDAPGHSHTELRLKVSPPHKGYTVETRGAMPAREGGAQTIELAPERQQLIGVVYARVERRPLTITLRATGRVEVDETQVSEVVLKYDAYVEQLFVDQTGQPVKKGDPLLTLYSPELLSAERDYLVALRTPGVPGSEQLVRAAEERLKLWNLGEAQIARLRKRGTAEPRVVIRSPADGTVLEKSVVAGTRAMAGNVLYRIGNLGRIWVVADLFESDAPYMEPGLPATLALPFAGGHSLKGTVQFVYPTVDEKTRSVRARLVFPNARLSLKPGMFADVKIEVPLGSRLSVPDDALLASGEHRYAFVKRGEGELQAREVKVGALGDYDEVLAGLSEGEEVATQATFLLSSEAQLRSALPRWNNP
ncbi:MAG: efflux RND transporter periplasmic adaptor subunit [Deltaproteobacteria bacterium]|nr:MAG: efflux RND transporter periplasmic adaptor subunit [Deltaproteobacteria bacterium]